MSSHRGAANFLRLTDASVPVCAFFDSRSLSRLVAAVGCRGDDGGQRLVAALLASRKTLQLATGSDAGVEGLGGYFTALRALDLSGCHRVTDLGLACLAPLTNLTSLRLEGCDTVGDAGLAALAPLSARLVHLDLGGCDEVSNRGMEVLGAALPKLSSLRLAGCDEFGDDGCVAVGRALGASLTWLDVSGPNQLTDVGLAALGGLLPRLAYLDASHCYNLTDCGVSNMARWSAITPTAEELADPDGLPPLAPLATTQLESRRREPALSTLLIAGCIELSDAGLKALAPLSQLRALGLGGLVRVTDHGLLALAALPRLDRLDLSGMFRVSVAGIRALPSRVELSRLLGEPLPFGAGA